MTPFFSASGSQKTAVTPLEEGRQMPFGLPPPAGGSVPWRPSLITRASGSFLPPHSPTHRAQVRSEFLPQGHTAAILFSLASPGGITHPGKPAPLPGNARELLPAGALRSNVVGTYGSPTNAPSLTVEREWAAKRSERFSLLNKKARLRPCLLLRFQLPGRRHLRPLPRLCRRRLPPGSAQPAHPV